MWPESMQSQLKYDLFTIEDAPPKVAPLPLMTEDINNNGANVPMTEFSTRLVDRELLVR